MTDVHVIPDAIKHDLLAMFVRKLGTVNSDATPGYFGIDNRPTEFRFTELRIPIAEHAALPQSFVLDVYYDKDAECFVLLYSDIPDNEHASIEA